MRPVAKVALAVWGLIASTFAAEDPEPFALYVYGEDISGEPVFSNGRNLFVGDYTLMDDPQAVPIIITSVENKWYASPNTTSLASSKKVTWKNHVLAVPEPESSSENVTLVSEMRKASNSVTEFSLYGPLALAVDRDGKFVSPWYTVPSNIESIYLLAWNVSEENSGQDTAGREPVSLATTPPSNPQKL